MIQCSDCECKDCSLSPKLGELHMSVVCRAPVSRSTCACREVSEGVVQKLLLLKQALDQGNLNQALSIQVCCFMS